MKRLNVIGVLFLLMGIGLVIVGSMDSVTDALDEGATADSDPSGQVLPLIGVIWALVGLGLVIVPLLKVNLKNIFGRSADDDDQ